VEREACPPERAVRSSGQGASSGLLVYIRPTPTSEHVATRSSAIGDHVVRQSEGKLPISESPSGRSRENLLRREVVLLPGTTLEGQGLAHGTKSLPRLMNA